MWYVICGLAGYLVGTINPSYMIGRFKGFDIRKRGSGNAGGSNALITMGNKIGALCMVLDILKAFGIIKLVEYFLPGQPLLYLVTGAMCIIGHMFPFYMGFKGGKGFACLGGLILAYSAKLFIIMFLATLAFVIVTNYLCLGPIAASLAFTIIYGVKEQSIAGTVIMAIITLVILYKHRGNLRNIKAGTEARFSFLWNKEEETARVQKNRGEI